MEQHQFKVSFPLRYKLLTTVISLLLGIMGFLTISTTFLIKDDKTAFTYLIQETEAQLVGKDFINLTRRSLDTLKQGLASINPLKKISAKQREEIKALLENQAISLGLQIQFLDEKTGQVKLLHEQYREDDLQKLKLKRSDLLIKKEWLEIYLEQIQKQAFAFINVSQTGSTPLIAVIFADLEFKSRKNGLPIAIGYIPFHRFAKEVKGSHLTITDHKGWILFDSDPAVMFSRKNISDDPLFIAGASSKTSTGAMEFTQEKNQFLGNYVRPGFGVLVFAKTKLRKALASFYELIEKFLIIGAMTIGVSIILLILFSKTLTAPISRLYDATKEVAAGKFDLKLESKGKDEIGALSNSFNVMSQKIQDLIAESMEKVRMENELAIASTVQQTLLPPSEFKTPNILINGYYEAASECGGDWWGYFPTNNKLALFIADATGHGLPSALVTASARSCISMIHKLTMENPEYPLSPGHMLTYANKVIHDTTSGNIMMTFFAAVIDFDAQTITYASAGHNPPWLFQLNGDKYRLKSLTSKGTRLGEKKDVPIYQENTVKISKNDMLFIYTDGIMEGTNPSNQMYGKKQVKNIVEAHLKKGPKNVIQELVKDFKNFNGEKPFDDDVTLAVAQFFPNQ